MCVFVCKQENQSTLDMPRLWQRRAVLWSVSSEFHHQPHPAAIVQRSPPTGRSGVEEKENEWKKLDELRCLDL